MKFVMLLIFTVSVFVISASVGYAQEEGLEGIARPLVSKEKVVDGQIVSFDGESMSVAKKEFDPNIYGVAVADPALAIMDLNNENSLYVATSGKALVKVSAKNGEIKVNDLVTSSDEPGVGVKADGDGVVLGTALQEFDSSGSGFISVNVRPHFSGEAERDNFIKNNLLPIVVLIIVLIVVNFIIVKYEFYRRKIK